MAVGAGEGGREQPETLIPYKLRKLSGSSSEAGAHSSEAAAGTRLMTHEGVLSFLPKRCLSLSSHTHVGAKTAKVRAFLFTE